MTKLQFIVMLIFGVVAIVALVVSVLAINKEDKSFDGKIIDEDGNQVSISDWLQSEFGKKYMNTYLMTQVGGQLQQNMDNAANAVIKNGKYSLFGKRLKTIGVNKDIFTVNGVEASWTSDTAVLAETFGKEPNNYYYFEDANVE